MIAILAAAYLLRTDDPADFLKWGNDVLDVIEHNYWQPDRLLYTEEAGGRQPAFDWAVGVLIPALDSAAALDPANHQTLTQALEGAKEYWNTADPVAGYDVLPMPKPKDRYYDDNEWMVLGLVEASQVLHSKRYLDQAEETFDFVKSGWDTKLGGGVYWRESAKTGKNTCSNAPAAAAALALYHATRQKDFLEFAKADYAWTKANLRDPVDGLYFDNVTLEGKIDHTKWSYNSGLMLRSAVDLYRETREKQYAVDAREILASSLKQWIAPDGAFKDEGKFGFLLIDAWLRAGHELLNAPDPVPVIEKALRIVHDRGRDANGEYGSRWDSAAPADGYLKPKLIDQAAVARAYLELYSTLPKPDKIGTTTIHRHARRSSADC